MTQENQNSPEMYQIPTIRTEALDAAMADKQAFADEINANEASHTIEVDVVPSEKQSIVVRRVGDAALNSEGRIPIAPEAVTPQMQANALGSPYHRDAVDRIVPS